MPDRNARLLDRFGLGRVPRSLGAKLVLTLTGVGLVGSLALAALLSLVITPSFTRLENAAVAAHVERTRAALDGFARDVEATVRDYGDWNSSYDYMTARSVAFERDSGSTPAMRGLGVSGMAYVASDGRAVFARWIDPITGADRPPLRAQLIAAIPAMRIEALLAQRSPRAFYIRIGDRLVAIGVARVRRSDGTGAPRGYVLMARELSSPQLRALLQLPATVEVAAVTAVVRVTPEDRTLAITVPVPGVDGRPVANTRFSIPRDLSLLGGQVLFLAVGGAVMLMLVMLVALRGIIARLVLRPLHCVEQHMGAVQASGTPTPLSGPPRADEIGNLVTSFNAMLRQLNDLRERVEVQSFKLGQSESAVAVMHNVRNALAPIGTILSKGLATVPVADRALIDRALSELAGDAIPPARRRKLAAFVTAATHADAAERAQRDSDLEVGRVALHNVVEIIGRQQQQAHEAPPIAICDLSDVVAQNAAIARYSGATSIAFVFPSKPHPALGNRVILSQVVGNLFANAAEAITARGGEGGAINVAIHDSGDRVELVIRDDGEGFDAGEAPQFFQRGFSTRAHKSGGLGLHWCANAMLAMGGSLRLESDGRGTGARAILTLPVPATDGARSDKAA